MSNFSNVRRGLLTAGVFSLFVFLICFTTCDVLGTIGMGNMVNTEKPAISMPDDSGNAPGSFMRGNLNCIELSVEQPFGISEVYMTVWYIDKETETLTEKVIYAEQYPPAPSWCDDATHTHKDGMWYVELDTSVMMDGQIRAQVTAIDVSGNESTTTDIVYTVKNTLPQLEMTVPQVVKTDYEIFDFMNDNDKVIPLMYATNSLMGIATDLYGIEEGYPQIMIWPVESDGSDIAGITLDSDDAPLSDIRRWGTWRTVLDDKESAVSHADGKGDKAVMFRWTTKNLIFENGKYRVRKPFISNENPGDGPINYPDDYFSVGRYHFKIRVKDKFGQVNIYPYRSDPDTEVVNLNNEYMSVYVALTTNPIIEFNNTEDRYYNAKGDFTRAFKVSAPNGLDVSNVQAIVTNSLTVDFNDDPKHAKIELVGSTPATGAENGEYRAIIKASDILNVTNGLSSDTIMIHVKVTDIQSNFSVSSLSFILDTDLPDIDFFNPAILSTKPIMTPDDDSLTSTVRFMGTAVDTSTRVIKMYYRLGKTEVSAPDEPNNPDYLTGWTDTGRDNPAVVKSGHIVNPSGNADNNLGSDVKWSGTLSNWRWEFAGAGGINDLYQSVNVTQAAGFTGNFYLDFGADLQSNVSNIWYLPMSFKIIDSAGNAAVKNIKVVVDPDKDKPRVIINSPNNNSLVGGEVPINGNAKDNELIYDILIKVIAQTDAQMASDAEGTDNVTIRLNPNKEIENGFVRIKSGGADSSVPFDFTLNAVDTASGIITTGLTPPAGQNKSRKVKVEIKARDANPDNATVPKVHTGTQYPASLELNFSAVLPVIDQIQIISIADNANPNTVNNATAGINYSPNINDTVSRRLVLRARIMDDVQITSIAYRQETEQNYTAITNSVYNNDFKPWVQTISAGLPSGYNDGRYLFIPLNTNAAAGAPNYGLMDGKYQNRADTYKIEIQVKDNTSPITFTNQETINLKIDNYFPIAYFNGNTKAAKAVNETYSIQGRAWELGGDISVGELERVVVYFTRNNAGLSLKRGQTATWVSTQRAASAPKGVPYPPAQGETPPLVPGTAMTETTLTTFPNVRQPDGITFATTNSGIVINTNATVDGYAQTFSGGSTLIDWSVQFDSTNIDDGRTVLNYVVFDKLGNASHYTQDVLIANNRPIITGINLGTDLNGDGSSANTLDITERRDFSVIGNETRTEANGYTIKTGFRVINSRLHFRPTFTGGNTSRHYRISPVTQSASPVNVVAGTIQKGEVYTIVEPGSINWINYGAFVSSNYTGTTFVATDSYVGTPPIGATVYTYTNMPGATVATSFNVTSNSTDLAFTNFTGISDGERLFLVKVYDRTYGTSNGGDESEQLADVVPIWLTLENTDNKAPVLDVSAFGKEWILRAETPSDINPPSKADTNNLIEVDVANYNRNIILECTNDASHDVFLSDASCPTCGHNLVTSPPTKRKGYVQYSAATADISGKVVFTGRAADNQRIEKITAAITNFSAGAEFNVALWDNTNRTLAASTGTGWRFKIIDPHLTIDYGHAINWEFSWDSSLVTNTAADNVNVTFRVYDRGPNVTTGIAKQRAVNVVPYITNIYSPLSDAYKANASAFNRSAHGWYPVREGQDIIITGFNLANGTMTSVAVNSTANSFTTTSGSVNKNSITGRVDTAATSGPLVVTVNGITSFNNRNDNTAGRVNGAVGTGYNDEPNGLNNNILTDDRNIYVWSVGSLLDKVLNGSDTTGITLEYPSFMVTETGRRLLAYNNLPTGNGRIALNNNVASITTPGAVIETTLNRYTNLVVTADTGAGSNPENWYIGGTTQTSNNITYYNLHARGATTQANANAGNQGTGINKTRILANRVNDSDANDSTRIRIPRVHSRNTGDNASMVVVSYGDSLIDQHVYLHYGPVSGAASSTLFSGDYVPALTSGNTTGGTTFGTTATIQRVTNTGTQHQGSIYTASASLSTGVPVIVWYDRINQNLLISYGNTNAYGASGTPTASWQGRATIVHTGAGTHVDMAVDGGNNIHLAYYDVFNGGLYYAYIPSSGIPSVTDTSTTKVSGITTVKVDTYLSAGTKIMINVREQGTGNYVPYISYLHSSFAETKNSVRTAWPVVASTGVAKPHNSSANVLPGTDANDRFTGNWEVMTVPAENVPLVDYFIANGVPRTAANWVTPTGTGALTAAGYTNSGSSANIYKTILIGYMTDTRYEGAVLKRDLWTP